MRDKGLTIVLVTREQNIAQFAQCVLVFRDGKIRKDDPVVGRPRASEVLKGLPDTRGPSSRDGERGSAFKKGIDGTIV